jgi:hypothetical protein
VGYARAEVASVSRRERDESRIWSDVLLISSAHYRVRENLRCDEHRAEEDGSTSTSYRHGKWIA